MNWQALRRRSIVTFWWLVLLTVGVAQAQTPGSIPLWLEDFSLGDSAIVQSGSNIGIGTSQPGQKLVVQTLPENYGVMHTDGVVSVGSWVGPFGTAPTGGWLGTQSNHPLHFYTRGSGASMTITTNGDVGIGTVTPEAKLHVNGSGYFTRFLVARTTEPDADGVSGISTTGDAPYGVYGSNSGNPSPRAFAGYFFGKVRATGGFFSGFGATEIDHPLDPGNKYLVHPFVSSSEMKTIYDGVVVLDARGEAWVDLPEYFETLNRDYRYQLTGIGAFAPVYIAQKIAGNRFKIAGGQPGMEVSWQVSGIRQDAFARTHRVEPERDKAVKERNYYLHPDLYGQSDEKSIEWSHKPELMRRLKEPREQ